MNGNSAACVQNLINGVPAQESHATGDGGGQQPLPAQRYPGVGCRWPYAPHGSQVSREALCSRTKYVNYYCPEQEKIRPSADILNEGAFKTMAWMHFNSPMRSPESVLMGDLDDCVTSGHKDTIGQVVQIPGSGTTCAKAPGQGQQGDQWAVGAGRE